VSSSATAEVVLDFPQMPTVPLWRLALARKPGVSAEQTLQPVVARVHTLQVGDSPEYRALCAYPGQGPVPLLWPFVVAAPLQKAALIHPAFPIRLLGMVHLRQTVHAARPIDPTEPLRAEVRLGTWRPARRGIEFDLETVLVDRAEQTVWSGVTTAWSAKGPGHGQDHPRPEVPTLDPTLRVPIEVPADMGRRYGRVARDNNPIHVHALTARPFGFKRAIVHGMWTLSRVVAALGERVQSHGVRLEVCFRKPVYLPDTVALTAAETEGGWAFRVDGTQKTRLFGRVSSG